MLQVTPIPPFTPQSEELVHKYLVTGIMGMKLIMIPVETVWEAHDRASELLADGVSTIRLYKLEELT